MFQSTHRNGNSTETDLLIVHSDIVESLYEGSMTRLSVLDVSASYDVIDHPIVLKHLEFSFRIKENARRRGLHQIILIIIVMSMVHKCT